nr:putative reverse transcriptase, RNA-dependent DNA polymerase, Gag-polypeptide of LTR copia-type [Tanacetum cinerariifolium]
MMKNNLKQTEFDSGVTKDLNHKKIDNENPKRPNDEGRVSSNNDGTELSPDNQEFNYDVEELPINTLRRSSRQTKLPNSLNDFIVEGKVKYEYMHSPLICHMNSALSVLRYLRSALGKEFNYDVEELPINTLRRSSRQTKLPNSLNDFIVEGKVKYDVERVVNYANLNHENFFFVSGLNKSVEPTCYKEAILDSN